MSRDVPHCTVCGERLVESISEDEIVTTSGDRVRFRRDTDFVVCPSCMALYRANDLREGRVEPVGETGSGGPARGSGPPE